MTDDNSNLVDMDNLDNFSDDFFQKAKDIDIEDVADTGDDAPATDEDKDASAQTEDDDNSPDEETKEEGSEETEDSEPEDDDGDEEEVEEKPEPKGKGKGRKSAQERINEITRQRYEERRQWDAEKAELVRRLEAIESRNHEGSKQEPAKQHLPQGAPDPDALDDDGNPIYPAGQYDPDFVKDLALFTVQTQLKAEKEAQEAEAQASEVEKAKAELRNEWSGKLDQYEEEVPEIREHLVELVETFQNVEPSYGEYLAMTLMQSENGPAIVEYLSQNIGEAQKIVASGPSAATLAIGRLDARLSRARTNEEEQRNTKKVSSAPEPPMSPTKGRKGTPDVRADTDDQEAFERLFFKKK